MTQTYDGQLEIDRERGVIYFHSLETGSTMLRICRLQLNEQPEKEISFVDVTTGVGAGVGAGVSYGMQRNTRVV